MGGIKRYKRLSPTHLTPLLDRCVTDTLMDSICGSTCYHFCLRVQLCANTFVFKMRSAVRHSEDLQSNLTYKALSSKNATHRAEQSIKTCDKNATDNENPPAPPIHIPNNSTQLLLLQKLTSSLVILLFWRVRLFLHAPRRAKTLSMAVQTAAR